MKTFLETYLSQKYQNTEIQQTTMPGPLVTISREPGCEAVTISKMLTGIINTYHLGLNPGKKWEIISKEILEASAKELQTNSEKIAYVFQFEKRSQMDHFFMSMTSKYYQSDWKVREAVQNVIKAFAQKGNAIILGRAGAQITHDIKNALHVKLVAPFEWRVNRIMEKNMLSQKTAEKKVLEMDENRKKIIELFSKKTACIDCYDVYYNVSSLDKESIVSDIIHMMHLKKLI